ncbi:MAG TPA: hypothetical protein PKD90_08760, partial [Phnomibacter sp.]|nr:hypothetical protein [Phnomibacter sp.]
NKDNTVYGRRTGFPDASGTWRGSSEDMSITSAFPASAAPLDKLTGKWMIKKTTLSSVNSTRTEGGITYELNLVKK